MFAAPAELELPERTRELGAPIEEPVKPLAGYWRVMLFFWWLFDTPLPVRFTWPPEARAMALISLLLMPEAPFLTFLINFLPEDMGWPSGMSELSTEL